jgi:T5orf172 domain
MSTRRGGPNFGIIELHRILAGQSHAPVVYFARVGEYIKIGTTTNLKSRMRSIYVPLEDVLALIPGGREVERVYHEKFAVSRVADDSRRELFRVDWRLRSFLGLDRPDREEPPVISDSRGEPITLAEAVDGGYAPGATVPALRQDRYLSDKDQLPDGLKFPEPVAEVRNGQAERFWSAEIAAFNEARRGRRVA